MTRAASVTRSAASLLTSRLLVAGIAMIFLGVSTRLLTLEEMAVFAVYNTFCGFLTVVCSLGLLATCIKKLPAMPSEGAPLLRVSLIVYGAGAAVVTCALWAGAAPISRVLLKTPDRAGDVRAAALTALCYGLYEASQLLLTAQQRFGRVGSYNVAAALVQRVVSLALFFPFGLKGYLAGFALGSLAGAGMGLATILPLARGTPSEGGGSGWRWLSYSMPFYADGYLRYLYMHADQLLVGIFLTPADLSIYFVAKRFIQYCQVLVSSLVDPLGTKVAELRETDPGAVSRAFAASLRYFVLLFVPLSVLLACLSPFLLLVIGGDRYAAGALSLALLFLSLPLFALFSHLSVFVYALGPPRERLIANLSSVLAQAAGIVALMPWLGLAGLALARLIGFGVAAVATRARLDRYLPPPARSDEGSAGRIAMQAAGPTAAMALLMLVPFLLTRQPALLPLWAAPAGAVCLGGYLLMVLTRDDRAALAALVPGQGSLARVVRARIRGAGREAG